MIKDVYPENHLNVQKMNSVVRHRLRNLHSGFDMAIDAIERDLKQADAPSAEKCDLLRSELDDLYQFTQRMSLLLDPLPDPEPGVLQDIITKHINMARKSYPFLNFHCEGTEEPLDLSCGNLYEVIIDELLANAVEATKKNGVIRIVWRLKDGYLELGILNSNADWPENVSVSPPVPFQTPKGQHDGIGLAITKKVCDAIGAELEILTDLTDSVGVNITCKTDNVLAGA